MVIISIYTHKIKVDQYLWWQLKIDPEVFNIDRWVKENPGSPFLWSPRQFSVITYSIFDKEVMKYVKRGHKIVLWVHNNPIGMYAIGEVLEDPFVSKITNDRGYYQSIRDREYRCAYIKIGFTRLFFDNPIDNHSLWVKGLSRYIETPFDLLLNRDLPAKLPYHIGPSIEQATSSASFQGKIDPWGWIPLKSIDLEIGEKIESLYAGH